MFSETKTRKYACSTATTEVGITPALTEASKSVQFVKMESDTMVAKRTSDD